MLTKPTTIKNPIEYNRFRKSLEFTLKWEGTTLVDDPMDAGGVTKFGISQKANPDVDVKNLTPSAAIDLYYERYWKTSGADLLPIPYCTAVFDTAVLCGPSRAVDWFEKSDGSYRTFIQFRRNFHINRVRANPSQFKFVRGWLNRCNDLMRFCEQNDPNSSLTS